MKKFDTSALLAGVRKTTRLQGAFYSSVPAGWWAWDCWCGDGGLRASPFRPDGFRDRGSSGVRVFWFMVGIVRETQNLIPH